MYSLHSQINDNDMNIVLDKLNISKIDNIHPRLKLSEIEEFICRIT